LLLLVESHEKLQMFSDIFSTQCFKMCLNLFG
jgi:hypothetical protein